MCGLSGFSVAGPEENATLSYSHVTGTTSTSSRHWGQGVRMSAKPAGRAAPTESGQMTRAVIEKHVCLFLASKERQKITADEFEKVRQSCQKAAKLVKSPPSIGTAIVTVSKLYDSRAKLCLPPAAADAPWLKTLSVAILEFWRQLSDSIPMKKKNAPSFVAACISFLSSDGLTIEGVVFIRPSRLVRLHCVLPRQFGLFSCMTCRRITQTTRAIKASLTLPSGRPRVVTPLNFS